MVGGIYSAGVIAFIVGKIIHTALIPSGTSQCKLSALYDFLIQTQTFSIFIVSKQVK